MPQKTTFLSGFRALSLSLRVNWQITEAAVTALELSTTDEPL